MPYCPVLHPNSVVYYIYLRHIIKISHYYYNYQLLLLLGIIYYWYAFCSRGESIVSKRAALIGRSLEYRLAGGTRAMTQIRRGFRQWLLRQWRQS